ncbi:MAG: protein kinase [Deltaproteobacteria bacterium]|nr:protein kinase [Deltaproteobacteria bacterium]
MAARIAPSTSSAALQAAQDLIDDNGEFLNLVHRDVSPQNILLGTDDAARLTDFGIAKGWLAPHADPRRAAQGQDLVHGPGADRRQEIDRRVDLFAMGIVVRELLAYRRLFHGDSDVEVLNHLLFEPIPWLRDAAPRCPRASSRS